MAHRHVTTAAVDSERLHEQVDAFTAARNQAERTDAFVELVRWVRRGRKASEAPSTTAAHEHPRLDRLLE